ncbi:LPXTG cell wall anchor domain-containing protein [Xylanimonas protaetiae]|uniref:LPXTG cell wall anchor domain-containing protein n=1 Tax=Xylanimonas protaetiae TaxID=2509457 RepID=A0A4P6FF29_9MICO|nr:LPXTG cell wall anchor domain-containing protein [Xylanimonas protaetiae]QAY69218.1 LPXTG cell wall anchor domain-containing protein [Xylanimonas protaetiae]
MTRTTHQPKPRGRARAAALTAAVVALLAVSTGVAAADTEPSPGASTPATEATTPAPAPSDDLQYPPPPAPSIDVTVLQPVCDGDVPYLRYAVVPTGTPNDTVTITWQNPSGDDVVMADLPLTGRVLWPGAKVDANGKPLDWPGWTQQADGTWVQGDEFDWVRPSATVVFKVNPEATTTVTYPPSSPSCATNPPGKAEPTIKVDTLTPVCVEGVTYLKYGVTVTGTPNTTATLTWHNPSGGADFVQAGQPLRGTVLWPGAYPERFVDLKKSDGWELVNNMWENTRDFGWAVGTVDVTFKVNPEVTVPVTFPQDTAGCVRAAGVAGLLPRTGAEVMGLVGFAAGLLALGTTVVVLTRRRRA